MLQKNIEFHYLGIVALLTCTRRYFPISDAKKPHRNPFEMQFAELSGPHKCSLVKKSPNPHSFDAIQYIICNVLV